MKKGSSHKEETKAKISEAMTGNDNAEKWNNETVMQVLNEFEDMMFNDKDYEFITLMDLLQTKRLYPQIWSEWIIKFKEDKTVSELIKRIEALVENKLVTGALKFKFNPTMSIFTLKNKHEWKDKNETDITTKGESIKETKTGLSIDKLISAINGTSKE